MSGGSYNYLHSYRLAKARREDIERMRDRLDQLGHTGTWAAEQTRYVLALIDDANARMEQLDEVWRAVEWHDSANYSAEQVREAIDKHEPRELRPPHVV